METATLWTPAVQGQRYLSPLFDDPWALDKWKEDFGTRENLVHKLRVLGHAFKPEASKKILGGDRINHPMGSDLLSIGGRARLLVVAEELLKLIEGGINFKPDAPVPLMGRLHNAALFGPMASEFLAARVLAPLAMAPFGQRVVWQPPERGWRCDFRVDLNDGLLVAEVKRPWQSRRTLELEKKWLEEYWKRNEGPSQSRLYSDELEAELDRAEATRFRRHFKKAADQLARSAKIAVGDQWRDVPGILFVDTNPNFRVFNTLPSIVRWWIKEPWAASIDLIVFLDYASRDGEWGIVATPICLRARTRALELLGSAHQFCENGHIHVPARADCTLPFGF